MFALIENYFIGMALKITKNDANDHTSETSSLKLNI